jgi:hypothetical protein
MGPAGDGAVVVVEGGVEIAGAGVEEGSREEGVDAVGVLVGEGLPLAVGGGAVAGVEVTHGAEAAERGEAPGGAGVAAREVGFDLGDDGVDVGVGVCGGGGGGEVGVALGFGGVLVGGGAGEAGEGEVAEEGSAGGARDAGAAGSGGCATSPCEPPTGKGGPASACVRWAGRRPARGITGAPEAGGGGSEGAGMVRGRRRQRWEEGGEGRRSRCRSNRWPSPPPSACSAGSVGRGHRGDPARRAGRVRRRRRHPGSVVRRGQRDRPRMGGAPVAHGSGRFPGADLRRSAADRDRCAADLRRCAADRGAGERAPPVASAAVEAARPR